MEHMTTNDTIRLLADYPYVNGDTFTQTVTVDCVHDGFPADGDPVLVDGSHRAICRGPVVGQPALTWVDIPRSSLIVPDRLRIPTRRLTPAGVTA